MKKKNIFIVFFKDRINILNEKKLKNMNVVGNYKYYDGYIV